MQLQTTDLSIPHEFFETSSCDVKTEYQPSANSLKDYQLQNIQFNRKGNVKIVHFMNMETEIIEDDFEIDCFRQTE